MSAAVGLETFIGDVCRPVLVARAAAPGHHAAPGLQVNPGKSWAVTLYAPDGRIVRLCSARGLNHAESIISAHEREYFPRG